MSIYGLIIGIAVVVGIELIKRSSNTLTYKDILIILISSLVGARILFLLHNIAEIQAGTVIPYAIWDGGLAFFGGLIGLLLSTYLISKKKSLPYFKLTDSLLLYLPLIQSIGRIGNLFNYELYGKPTSLPWGIFIPEEYRQESFLNYTHYHPVFLYESILNIITFVILLLLKRKFKISGLITGIYLISYSITRLLMNTLRIDKEYFFIFETSDLLSALFLISGILIMLNNMKRESLKNKLAKVLSRAVTLSLILLAVTSIFLHTKLSLEYDLLLLLLSVLIPSLSIILFKVLGITSDFNVTKREERVRLFGVMGMTFLLALLLSFKTGDIRLITIYTTLNLTFLLGLLITLFEKISFHMIWSMLSIFFIIYLWQIPYLYLLLLLIPLIGWSRLQLKRHTLRQVILGFLLTSICILLVLTFLKF